MNARLRITDGTTYVDFLGGAGMHLQSWSPRISGDKSVFSDSPVGDERRMTYRRKNTAIETIDIYITGVTQNEATSRLRKLEDLLEASKNYWTSPVYASLAPVYIHAQSECDDLPRYALILDARIAGHNNPHAQPFATMGKPTLDVSITVERSQWMEFPPGTANDSYLEGAFDTVSGIPVLTTDANNGEIDCAASSSIHNLPSDQFTVEGWFRAVNGGAYASFGYLFSKYWSFTNIGWDLRCTSGEEMQAAFTTTGADIAAVTISSSDFMYDNNWHHIALQYNDSATSPYPADWAVPVRIPEIYIDGVYVDDLISSSPAISALDDDSSVLSLFIGQDLYTQNQAFNGQIGWCRISYGMRYSPNYSWQEGDSPTEFAPSEGSFTPGPNSRPYICSPPVVDGNTRGQWNMSEGTGATVDNETGEAALDGTIANMTWTYPGICLENTAETVERPFIANFHAASAITDMYVWDASATTYTGNLIPAVLPYNIWPNPISQLDKIYFGNSDSNLDGPFTNVIFDIAGPIAAHPGTGFTVVWEYWNGATWHAFSGDSEIYDSTNSMAARGITGAFWALPSDWATGNLNTIAGAGAPPSVDGWWVRVRADSSPSPNTYDIEQQNRTVYTANRNGVYIPDGTVSGDTSALANIVLEQKFGHYDHVLVGSKKYNTALVWRTPEGQIATSFRPSINILNNNPWHNDPGIGISVDIGSIGATSLWPTGERWTCTHGATGTGTATITISGAAAQLYAGAYRVFATIALASGTDIDVFESDLTYKVNDTGDDIAIGSTVAVDQFGIAPYYHVYEYGQLTIAEDREMIGQIEFNLTLESVDGGGGTAYLYQMILFPVDGELFADIRNSSDSTSSRHIGHDGTSHINGAEVMELDGVLNPRRGQMARALNSRKLSMGQYLLTAPNGVVIPIGDQTIWFLAMNISEDWGVTGKFVSGPEIINRLTVIDSGAYRLMRGDT